MFDQEVQYIKWCEETIQLVESCKYLLKDATLDQNSINSVLLEEIKEKFLN